MNEEPDFELIEDIEEIQSLLASPLRYCIDRYGIDKVLYALTFLWEKK